MNPTGPYSVLALSQPNSSNSLGWTINPNQLNSSGILPGLTNISVAGSISVVDQATGARQMIYGLLSNGKYGLQFLNGATGAVEFQAVTDSSGRVTWNWYDNTGNTVMMVGWLPVTQIYGWAVATPGQNLAGQV